MVAQRTEPTACRRGGKRWEAERSPSTRKTPMKIETKRNLVRDLKKTFRVTLLRPHGILLLCENYKIVDTFHNQPQEKQ